MSEGKRLIVFYVTAMIVVALVAAPMPSAKFTAITGHAHSARADWDDYRRRKAQS